MHKNLIGVDQTLVDFKLRRITAHRLKSLRRKFWDLSIIDVHYPIFNFDDIIFVNFKDGALLRWWYSQINFGRSWISGR